MEATTEAAAAAFGVKSISLSLPADLPFDKLVGILKDVLVIPELPGVRGCRPCLSGLDRFVLESPVLRQG